jgi:hypothetical protein
MGLNVHAATAAAYIPSMCWSRNEQKKSKQILCIAPALKPQIEKAARFVIENSMGVRARTYRQC